MKKSDLPQRIEIIVNDVNFAKLFQFYHVTLSLPLPLKFLFLDKERRTTVLNLLLYSFHGLVHDRFHLDIRTLSFFYVIIHRSKDKEFTVFRSTTTWPGKGKILLRCPSYGNEINIECKKCLSPLPPFSWRFIELVSVPFPKM